MEREFSEEHKSRVWSDAAEVIRTHYDELILRWKAEMDTLLVYVSTTRHLIYDRSE